ncbi:hypothetical protein GCM10027160_36150 [Streptomyces calidiresistens]
MGGAVHGGAADAPPARERGKTGARPALTRNRDPATTPRRVPGEPDLPRAGTRWLPAPDPRSAGRIRRGTRNRAGCPPVGVPGGGRGAVGAVSRADGPPHRKAPP